MQPEAPLAPTNEPAKGLPPVAPPSGKFLAQLFLVPFLIVTCLVCFALFVRWFTGTAWSPEEYLERLDSPNADVRWRGAETLAQVLLREEHLASDPKFALDLTERLRKAWQENLADEGGPFGKSRLPSRADGEPAEDPLLAKRKYLTFLTACVGSVMVPVGARLLDEMAVNPKGSDPRTTARRRWQAVWALANLGESTRRFDKLPPARQEAVLAGLANETTTGSRDRAEWAREASAYLSGPRARSLEVLGVEQTLTTFAADPDPFLREMAAFALNFWEGTPAEDARLEAVLVRLASDDGHGEDTLAGLRDEHKLDVLEGVLNPAAGDEALTRSPGLKIRYNATIALARRGSGRVRLGVLQEMLDPAQQEQNFQVKHRDGKVEPDAETVRLTVTTALQAVAELHRRKPAFDLSKLNPALDALAQSPNTALRTEAERTRAALGKR